MRRKITFTNAGKYFCLEPPSRGSDLRNFNCAIREYGEYLFNDAARSLDDHVAKTWLLREKATGVLVAYMSVIADAIKLSFTEKERHGLNYPFRTIPAMKIAKLAADEAMIGKYMGIGTFMIQVAERLAAGMNKDYCAARFLTVDADVGHDQGVLAFYEKNGFLPNAELRGKNRKTISMRKDIYG